MCDILNSEKYWIQKKISAKAILAGQKEVLIYMKNYFIDFYDNMYFIPDSYYFEKI